MDAGGTGGKSLFNRMVSSLGNLMSSDPKKPLISSPYNPIHLTHVGFNQDTGDFIVQP
jgi:hypothetical protein